MAASRYRLVDLGHYLIVGWPKGRAAINSKGDVAASVANPNPKPHTWGELICVWHNGDPKLLTISSVADFELCGTSNSGEIAGNIDDQSGAIAHAAVLQDGKLVDIGALMGGGTSASYGSNDIGQVVGSTGLSAFIWQDGKFTMLNAPDNGYCEGYAISDSGDVAGSWMPHSFDVDKMRIFLDRHGKVETFKEPEGLLLGITAINDSDQIIGEYGPERGGQGFEAFMFQDGKVTNLAPPSGYLMTRAHDINDLGQIVGDADTSDILSGRAMLWENGKAEDLNMLIAPSPDWKLTAAYGINDNGEIVCQGWYQNHEWHVVLLIPIESQQKAPAK